MQYGNRVLGQPPLDSPRYPLYHLIGIISDMAKLLNWGNAGRLLRQTPLTLFSPQDLMHLSGASETSARFLLTRAVKRQDCLKLRRGLYALPERLPSEMEVANALYRPSYISFKFALSYYELIPESVYTITSATPRTTAAFDVLGRHYAYHRLKRVAFSGYSPTPINGQTIWIAEPEKALVDSMYLAVLEHQDLPERLRLQKLSKTKIRAYTKLFQHQALIEAIEKVL